MMRSGEPHRERVVIPTILARCGWGRLLDVDSNHEPSG